MNMSIPQGLGSYETGCHTALGNDLALYAQTTSHLHEQREKLFISMLAQKLNWSGLSEFNVLFRLEKAGMSFLKIVVEHYEAEISPKRSHIKMGSCEAGDFIAWLAREFDAWEMDDEPLTARRSSHGTSQTARNS